MQSEQLPMESQVLEDEVLAGAKRADNPPEEMPKRNHHGKNIIGTIRIQLCAKSFILQVYDVLARHSPQVVTSNGTLATDRCRHRSRGIDQPEIEQRVVTALADILCRLLQDGANLRWCQARVRGSDQCRYPCRNGSGSAGACGLHIPNVIDQLSADCRGQREAAPARAGRWRP